MDFGLARRTDAEDLHLTQSGLLMGTPAYMPPEQINGDAQGDRPGQRRLRASASSFTSCSPAGRRSRGRSAS